MIKLVSILFLMAVVTGCGRGTETENFCKKASDRTECESDEFKEKCTWDTSHYSDGACRPKS